MMYRSQDAAAAIVLAMAAAAIAILLTKAAITRKFRHWVSSKSRFLEGLFQCPYCMGHWWVFPGAFYYDLRIIQSHIRILDIVISGFAVIVAATILEALMILALSVMNGQGHDNGDDKSQGDAVA